MFQYTKGTCTNCGQHGHTFRLCTEPVTSFGTILIRVNDPSWNQASILSTNHSSFTGFENNLHKLEVLLIQRRDSLGYVEVLRGKYNHLDLDYIKIQVCGSTDAEREKLLTSPFDDLWAELWGFDTRTSSHYRNDKEISRQKLQQLRDGIEFPTGILTLKTIIQECNEHWDTPEWGFPKGRKDPHENDLACALREMTEETGIHEKDITVIHNIEPLTETFVGSNHIRYCHKYYTVFIKSSVNVVYDETNLHMRREIGNLQWFSIENALNKIRPNNIEKRDILLKLTKLTQMFCPLVHGAF